jgi:stage V sporulation protein B
MTVGSNPVEPVTADDELSYLGGDITAAPLVYPVARFSRQVAWTVLVRGFMIISSLAVGIIVARWLGSRGLGALAVLNLTVAYAVQIGSLGLVLANTYYIARDPNNLVPASVNALVFSLGWGSIAALLTFCLVGMVPGVFGDIQLKLMGVAVLSIPFQLITLFGLNILLAMGLVERLNVLDTLAQLFLVINAFVALILLKSGLWTLVSLNTAASIVVSFIVLWAVVRSISRKKKAVDKWRPDIRLLAGMMRYAVKMYLQTVAGLLLFRMDLLIVKYFRGAAEAGVYAVASQVGLLLMLVPAVISTLLFPRVAAERDASGMLACRITRHTVPVMAIVCLFAAPALFALPLLYGAPFADARTQALILLPGVFLLSIGGVLSNHFSGTGLPIVIPLFWVATLGFNIVLNLALVPEYGARGAALSSTVSYSLTFVFIALYFRARTGNSFRTAFLLSKAELRKAVRVFG